MIPPVQSWLDEEIEVKREFEGVFRMPRKRRIAQLVSMNGGLTVGSWGYLKIGGPAEENPWGRGGLEEDEALELMAYDAMLSGIIMCYGATVQEIGDAVKKEIRSEWEQYQKSLQEAPEEG